jgi:hypothetical protein
MADSVDTPADFLRAVESINNIVFREDITVSPLPSPQGVAPYSFALSADVLLPENEHESQHGTGRFILLYDPSQPESWGGAFRVVSYAQAPLESDIGLDPFLANVAWSWLEDALSVRKAEFFNIAGTATRILSTGLGELAVEGDGAQIELRASWSPASPDMGNQAEAWAELLCMLAGLPPTSEAASLTAHRRERD